MGDRIDEDDADPGQRGDRAAWPIVLHDDQETKALTPARAARCYVNGGPRTERAPLPPNVCGFCAASLTPEVLLDQANGIMAQFAGRDRSDELTADIREILDRVAGPLNAGVLICYSCADAGELER